MKKFLQKGVVIGILTTTALVMVAGLALLAQSQIQSVAGLAVAQSSTRWANVKDAGTLTTDANTGGLLSTGLLLYNGTAWDRVRGDTTNGMWVNVKTGNLLTTASMSSAFTNGQVAIATSAATLVKALNLSRRSIMIYNIGGSDAYVGTAAVTTLTGFLMKSSNGMVLDKNTAAIYAIASGATTTISYLED